jgi:tetratricopeptide (TPR) repeat protein
LLGSNDGVLRLWDVYAGKELRRFAAPPGMIEGVAIAPDGGGAVAACEDRTVRLYNLEDGKEVRRLEGHRAKVASAVFSPDGRRVLSSGEDGTVRLWRVDDGGEVAYVQTGSYIRSVAFSPDGRRALSGNCAPAGGNAGGLTLWRLPNAPSPRKEVRPPAPPAKLQTPIDLAHAFASQGQWQKAAAEYGKAAPTFPQDLGIYCEFASALVLARDRAGYRRVRAEVLQRFAKAADPNTLYLVARTASLAADETSDQALAVKLAEGGAKALRGGMYRHTLAVAHYRAGLFKRAIVECHGSLRTDPAWGGHVVDWLLLALAYQRQGQPAEAHRWLHKAVQWMDQAAKGLPKDAPFLWPVPSWCDRLEIQLLRREADSLLSTKEKGKKAKD